MSITETIVDIPSGHIKNIFGQFDIFVKKIEKALNVTIIQRDGDIKIIGELDRATKAKSVFMQLVRLSEKGMVISEQHVDYALSLCFDDKESSIVDLTNDLVCHTINGKPIRPKTLGQKA